MAKQNKKNYTKNKKNFRIDLDFYSFFSHSSGVLWGSNIFRVQNISNFRLFFFIVNVFIFSISALLSINGYLSQGMFNIITCSTSLLNAFLQLIDSAYIIHFKQIDSWFYLFSISNLLYWISQALSFANKGSVLFEKIAFCVGILTVIPSFLKFSRFMIENKNLNEEIWGKWYDDSIINYIGSPVQASVEIFIFFIYDEMTGAGLFKNFPFGGTTHKILLLLLFLIYACGTGVVGVITFALTTEASGFWGRGGRTLPEYGEVFLLGFLSAIFFIFGYQVVKYEDIFALQNKIWSVELLFSFCGISSLVALIYLIVYG